MATLLQTLALATAALDLAPGEKLLEAVPAFESLGPADGPFGVRIDEASLRVFLDVKQAIVAPGKAVVLTLTGPGDFVRTQTARWFNAEVQDITCDQMSAPIPVGGSGG